MSETQTEMQAEAKELDMAPNADCSEDLEDGEIDDSDEERHKFAEDDVASSKASEDSQQHGVSFIASSSKSLPTDTLNSDMTTEQPQSTKSKKPQAVDDDFDGSIERAIANALKKKGIEPTMPKILESKLHQENSDESGAPVPGHGQSKTSRSRKRKKQEKEKEKKKEKKRAEMRKRYDASVVLAPPPLVDEMDMDEFEMMNVRGWSPPPMSAFLTLPPMRMFKEYDWGDDSLSSYDSYESNDEKSSERHKRRRKRYSRRRKDKRSDDKRRKNRSRRESLDEKHRNEPRKLEMCKFYFMECCAKRDNCSYMHAEFPCKYYYLGMECTAKDDCKFSHGEPLTEELRNILIKHLESAPKVILGDFMRMSREKALNMVVKRHEELCRQFNAQNICNETKRESRWADNSSSNATATGSGPNNNIQPPSKSAPSYLDLKNLTEVFSAEHVEKLSQMGIVNLEQVNELTFGHLNQLGLTIAEITEIQLNAINLAKLSVTGGKNISKKGHSVCALIDSTTSLNGDVDMRFLLAGSTAGTQTSTGATNSASALELPEREKTNSSSNSDNSSCVVMVDYSQYLKDSNISFDKGDLLDDEKDDDLLIIDDDNIETDDDPPQKSSVDNISPPENIEKSAELFDMSEFSKTSRNPFKTAVCYGAENKTSETMDGCLSGDRKLGNTFDAESTEGSFHLESRRSRSRSPPESLSNTLSPASQSPKPFETLGKESSPEKDFVYEISTIYDFNSAEADNDDRRSSRLKSDKDMLFLPGSLLGESSGDIDLRLPFQPMTNYTPVTEIDGSITSYLPINYSLNRTQQQTQDLEEY